MSAFITKKNWMYWLLLAFAFMLLFLYFKSKARTNRINRQLKETMLAFTTEIKNLK